MKIVAQSFITLLLFTSFIFSMDMSKAEREKMQKSYLKNLLNNPASSVYDLKQLAQKNPVAYAACICEALTQQDLIEIDNLVLKHPELITQKEEIRGLPYPPGSIMKNAFEILFAHKKVRNNACVKLAKIFYKYNVKKNNTPNIQSIPQLPSIFEACKAWKSKV